MAQGRISFAGISGTPYRHVAGNGSAGAQVNGSSEPTQNQASGITESMIARVMPDVADRWIMENIHRKREMLHKTTALQRERIEEFVELLFDEDTDLCQDMIDKVAAEHHDPQKVVEALFEPAARVIGENWCADECDFMKVTIAVSRMQRLFRRLSSDFPINVQPDLNRCALLGPAPGEQHSFGLSVVEDAFRRGGWEVDCCGNGEEADMLRLVATNNYEVIGISVSVERLVPDLAVALAKLRSKSRNKSVVLMAGGSMIMQNPQAAIDAGFDLLAVDALSAVRLAESVIASPSRDTEGRMAAE